MQSETNPIIDSFLRKIVPVSAGRLPNSPSTKEIDNLIFTLHAVCNAIWPNIRSDWRSYAQTLNPYGPAMIIPLLYTEALYHETKGKPTTKSHSSDGVTIVLAKIIDDCKTASYAIVDSYIATKEVSPLALEYYRIQWRAPLAPGRSLYVKTLHLLAETLRGLAWPYHELWPERSQEVSSWADDTLKTFLDRNSTASSELKYNWASEINSLGWAKDSYASSNTCPRFWFDWAR